jgi:hypothetical protein
MGQQQQQPSPLRVGGGSGSGLTRNPILNAAAPAASPAVMSSERRGFLQAAYRAFSRVMSAGGVLEVRPLQGLNLPHPKTHDQALYCKVRRLLYSLLYVNILKTNKLRSYLLICILNYLHHLPIIFAFSTASIFLSMH